MNDLPDLTGKKILEHIEKKRYKGPDYFLIEGGVVLEVRVGAEAVFMSTSDIEKKLNSNEVTGSKAKDYQGILKKLKEYELS